MDLIDLNSASDNAQAGLAYHDPFVELLLFLLAVSQEQLFVGNWSFHVRFGRLHGGIINIESLGDELEEEDARQDFTEVHAALLQQAVLSLEEVGLLVDVIVDL